MVLKPEPLSTASLRQHPPRHVELENSLPMKSSLLISLLAALLVGSPSAILAGEPAQQGVQASPEASAYPFSVRVVGKGTPMVMIAGLGVSAEVFDGLAKEFADGHECHLVTLGGFAGEPPVAAPVMTKYREGLIRYMADKKLDRPILVGQSIGGTLAYWVAATAPDSVRSVVVIDGSPWITGLIFPDQTPESYSKRAREIRQETLSQTPEIREKRAKFGMATMVRDQQALDRIIEWHLDSDPETLAQANLEMFTTDIRPELAGIKVPVMLVAAPGDTQDPEALEAVRKNYSAQLTAIRNLRVEVAAGSRHFVQYEKPEFLTRVMHEFLDSQSVPLPPPAGK